MIWAGVIVCTPLCYEYIVTRYIVSNKLSKVKLSYLNNKRSLSVTGTVLSWSFHHGTGQEAPGKLFDLSGQARRTMQSKSRKGNTLIFYRKTLLASTDRRSAVATFFRSIAPDPINANDAGIEFYGFLACFFGESNRASSPISNGASFLISLRWAKLS